MKTIKKSLLIGLIFSLLWLGVPLLTVNAAPIVINDALIGTLLFQGLPVVNPDSSITYYGVTYWGTGTGNISGNWAMVLVVNYPPDSTTGNVLAGSWAVGTRMENVYGYLSGKIDPTVGDFNLIMLAIGGFGAYMGMAGTGYFQGNLSNYGLNIDGSLSLILVPSEAKAHGEFGEIDDKILSALILLGP